MIFAHPAESFAPESVLVDIGLPGMDGRRIGVRRTQRDLMITWSSPPR